MSKLHSCLLFNCLALMAMPFAANAAGTYYTGAAYQPAQYRYGQSGTYASSGYNNMNYVRPTTATSSVRYNNYSAMDANSNYQNQQNMRQQQQSRSAQSAQQSKGGFYANAGITHESAMWKMEMKKDANSVLRYDDVAWNVLDLNGGYIFDLGNTKMQVDAGFKYGMQWGEATMMDDDISKGGYLSEQYPSEDGTSVINIIGHALSVGSSKDGNMLGFNAGLGLTDFLKWGGLKITPSVGYRYLKYKLETKQNSGLMVDSLSCFAVEGSDEVQCNPVVYAYYGDDSEAILSSTSGIGRVDVAEAQYIDISGTYYYRQPGVSHSYETEWSGPYLALDMVYDINQNNKVNGRVELGFPGYKSTGDQPYRWDWEHPTSVEDSADMFSAFHLGLAANWTTAVTDSVSFSLGLVYDYYSVSGATAKTYLNKQLYNQLLAANGNDETTLLDPDTGNPLAIYLNKARNSCGGWVCESKKEIDSIYKSMGIRVGIDARF